MFNRDLFRAKCIEHGIRTQDAAQIMGINPATLSRKMGGQSDFTRNEIQLFRAALHLTPQENLLTVIINFTTSQAFRKPLSLLNSCVKK